MNGKYQVAHWMGGLTALVAFSLCAAELPARPPAPPLPVEIILPELQITAPQVRPHVEFLAAPEREGRGYRGKPAAADYIVNHFKQLGLQPLFGESYLQHLPDWQNAKAERPIYVGANIGAVLPGSDPELKNEWIILNAHYDHLGIRNGVLYPGADDNASGVAMLLESARAISQSPSRPKRSIAFVAFDFEERLLWGSRWFVAHPPCDLEQIKFCLTADMLGRSLGNLSMRNVFIMGSEHSPELRPRLQGCNPTPNLELSLLGADMVGTRSDYGPFRDEGIPFLFFSTGEHPDYHTPQDTPDKIEYDKLAEISTLMARLTLDLAQQPQAPAWSPGNPRELIDADTIHRITAQIMAADDAGLMHLGDLHRTFVSQLHSKTGYALRRGKISPDERVWLIRDRAVLINVGLSAFFLLVSVF